MTSDSETSDPTANSSNVVSNDTGFAWSAYVINIYMNKPFTLDAAGTPLDGWQTSYVPGPASLGSYVDQDNNPAWSYMATVDYFTLDPSKYILPVPAANSQGEFDVTFTWEGSTVYELELIPIAPEPASLALLVLGGLFIRRRR